MCQYKCILESNGNNGWLLFNLSAGFRKNLSNLKKRFLLMKKKSASKIIPSDNPGTSLSVGDYVKVRTKEELLELMEQKEYNCPIMVEMYKECGKTFKVFKEVKYFYDEVKEKLCKCKNIYLLEGSHCTSSGIKLPEPCDLNCFFFWHKDWLVKM